MEDLEKTTIPKVAVAVAGEGVPIAGHDGEAVVSAIGATGLPTPAQLAWQLLTSSMPFFDVALRLALDNIATTATATAATAATAASAAAQASVTAKGGGAAPRLQL